MRKELPKVYDPRDVESRIYKMWMDNGCFRAEADPDKKPFSIVMPPPNVTGQLHMGHAMDSTLQDILTRFKRMQGYSALWLPGTDHAGIATQIKVEENLRNEEGLREAGRDGKTHFVVHGNLDVTAHDSPVPGATGRQQQGGADQSNCQPFHFLEKFI